MECSPKTIDDENNREQYSNNAGEYLEESSDGHIGGGKPESRAGLFGNYLPSGSRIFEIGGGGGLDAEALEKYGYEVKTSDFIEEFVEEMISKDLDAVMFDAKQDNLPSGYDAVYANAVFVHFTPYEISRFLEGAKVELVGPKLIFISVINGNKQERRAGKNVSFERDFQDYSEEMLGDILLEAGFTIKHIELVDQRWWQVVASAA